MQLTAYKRFPFKGTLWIPQEDTQSQAGTIVFIEDHDINFDFSDDPTAPRQIIVCGEPLPTTAKVTAIQDRYGNFTLPGGEWTITSVQAVINAFGQRELYTHQAALSTPPDFGYPIYR